MSLTFTIDGIEESIPQTPVATVIRLKNAVDKFVEDRDTHGKIGGSLHEVKLYMKAAEWHLADLKRRGIRSNSIEKLARAFSYAKVELAKAGLVVDLSKETKQRVRPVLPAMTVAAGAGPMTARGATLDQRINLMALEDGAAARPFYKKPLFIIGTMFVVGGGAIALYKSRK